MLLTGLGSTVKAVQQVTEPIPFRWQKVAPMSVYRKADGQERSHSQCSSSMTPMTPKVIRVESAFGYKDAQVEKNAVVDTGDTVQTLVCFV